jgi:rod shape-determining protein MreD
MKTWIKYPVMFIILVLIQVLFFNQINFNGFLNPYIYVLFILLLPVSLAPYKVILLSFLLGLTIDWFSNTMGLHAAATVMMGFIRLPVIRMISAKEGEQSDYPGLKQTSVSWFLLYISILVFVHHLFLFSVEVFTFDSFYRTILRSLASSVFTVIVIFLSQYLLFRE